MTTPAQTKDANAASIAAKLVAFGDKLITFHIPYVWGGTTTKGFDCSGFVQFVYRKFGYKLPRTAAEQAHVGTTVPRNALQPGDLLFYDITHANSHVAMYAGGGQQIVARHTGTFLQRQKVGNFSHAQRIIGNIPGGTVGGIATTPANLAVDPTGLANLIPTPANVWSAIGASLGVSDMKDAMQRLGLIILGGGLLLYGIKMLASGTVNRVMGGMGGSESGTDEQDKESEYYRKKTDQAIKRSRKSLSSKAEREQRARDNAMEKEIEGSSRAVTAEETMHRAANA